MRYLLSSLPVLMLATDAHARVIHTSAGTDPVVTIFLSIAATVVLSIVATRVMRIMRRR